MKTVRSLNYDGIQLFSEFLTTTRSDEKIFQAPLAPPSNIIDDPRYLESTEYNSEVDENKTFENRYELGEYLVHQLGKEFLHENYTHYGVWAWLALLWFNQLRSKKTKLTNKTGGTQRHEHFIPYEWFVNPLEIFPKPQNVAYRHSVRSSYEVVLRYGIEGKLFFSPNGVSAFGEAGEQFLSTPLIRNSPKLRELIKKYYTDDTGFIKKGAFNYQSADKAQKSKSRSGYGGIRRLTDGVLPRVKITYDIDLMPAERLLEICGSEFVDTQADKKAEGKPKQKK
jgi:hypothetical protein